MQVNYICRKRRHATIKAPVIVHALILYQVLIVFLLLHYGYRALKSGNIERLSTRLVFLFQLPAKDVG